jgi:hypothetical protein
MVDHRSTEDDRYARLTTLICPSCKTSVFVLNLPIPPWIWCGRCEKTPKLEKSAT